MCVYNPCYGLAAHACRKAACRPSARPLVWPSNAAPHWSRPSKKPDAKAQQSQAQKGSLFHVLLARTPQHNTIHFIILYASRLSSLALRRVRDVRTCTDVLQSEHSARGGATWVLGGVIAGREPRIEEHAPISPLHIALRGGSLTYQKNRSCDFVTHLICLASIRTRSGVIARGCVFE